jgi:DNA-binding MarR family transcriptional regulator
MPGHLIRRAQQIAVALFVEECGQLTPVQFAALSAVAGHPGIDLTRLAGLIALDKPTTGGVIDRLEAKDLLKRSADKSDKRLKRLTITPAGNRLLAAAQAGVARTQTRLLAPLSKAEQRLFVELLGRIVEGNNALSRAPQKPLPLPALEAAE